MIFNFFINISFLLSLLLLIIKKYKSIIYCGNNLSMKFIDYQNDVRTFVDYCIKTKLFVSYIHKLT